MLYINYGRLAAYLWRQRRAVSGAGLQSNVHVVNTGGQRRTQGGAEPTPVARHTLNVIKMLVTIALLFLAAWAPYFTIMTIKVSSL